MASEKLRKELAYDLLPVDEQFFSLLGLTQDSSEIQEKEQLESSRRLNEAVFLSNLFTEYSKAIAEIMDTVLAEDSESVPVREEIIESALVVFCAHMLKDKIIVRGE